MARIFLTSIDVSRCYEGMKIVLLFIPKSSASWWPQAKDERGLLSTHNLWWFEEWKWKAIQYMTNVWENISFSAYHSWRRECARTDVPAFHNKFRPSIYFGIRGRWDVTERGRSGGGEKLVWKRVSSVNLWLPKNMKSHRFYTHMRSEALNLITTTKSGWLQKGSLNINVITNGIYTYFHFHPILWSDDWSESGRPRNPLFFHPPAHLNDSDRYNGHLRKGKIDRKSLVSYLSRTICTEENTTATGNRCF